MTSSKTTIGLLGMGLATYWSQFPGLKPRLEGYLQTVETLVSTPEVNIVNAGLVDDPLQTQAVTQRLAAANVDALFVYITTYALSHTVLPIVRALQVPVLIINAQPGPAIDYGYINALADRALMTGEWLAWCQSCVLPELSNVFRRCNVAHRVLTGHLQEPAFAAELKLYTKALWVQNQLAKTRIGLVGQYYNGMMDVYSDLTRLAHSFGTHFELMEPSALAALRPLADAPVVAEKRSEFASIFNVHTQCSHEALTEAARTAVALDALVKNHQLQALAYYFEASGSAALLEIVTSIIPGLTLLTGKGIPAAGEYEVKNVLAMKIMSLLDAGGSFSEFYAMDFQEEQILLGHDGPAHYAMADGKVTLVPVPVYHGKPGSGLSIQMEVKAGPVTLLSVGQNDAGNAFLLIAEGEAVAGPTLQIGNTNSRYKFPLPIKQFMNQWSAAGPSHHCAIGVGHHAEVLRILAWLLKIDLVQIC